MIGSCFVVVIIVAPLGDRTRNWNWQVT